MIIFKTLQYKNFLSVGDKPIKIKFDDARSTLIVGANGSGKSSLLCALSFALFGKPHRKINKPQLINSINGKGLRVEVEFEIGPSVYRVVRGLKPNIFEIWCNGNMINQDSHSRDYQTLLETNILKLNHKSFHQVVVLGSSNFVPFMQLSAYHRREVIEDLLDISVFSKMNSVLKDKVSSLKEKIKDAEYDYNLIKEKIKLQSKHIESLKLIGQSNIEKYDLEINELQKQIEDLLNHNESMLNEYTAKYPIVKNNLDAANKKRNKLLGYENSIKDNILKIKNERKFYTDNTNCPTCNQSIEHSFRIKKLEECDLKDAEYSNGNAILKNELKQIHDILGDTENELSELLKLNNTVNSNNVVINNYERRIKDLKKIKSSQTDYEDLKKSQDILNSYRDQRDFISDLRNTYLDERSYNEVVYELLKDTGIKTKIIRQYLPVMNKLINWYLQTLDFFVSFELDENFNETIKSRHRDEFSYASFSEGEKTRIDLSIMFAWRQIAKMKNSANTNLLIMDEIFDSSLDSDGVENLLKIMNTLDEETCMYVITHKPESFEPLFERKMVAIKNGNFTSYTIESLKD